jgi:hypothetical protein
VVPTIDYARRVVWELKEGSRPMSTEAFTDFLFDRMLERLQKKPRDREEWSVSTFEI